MAAHDTETDRTEDQRPLLSWSMLFFGCFGSDAGSRAWSWRGAWGLLLPVAGLAVHEIFDDVLSETAGDVIVGTSFGLAIAFIYWTVWKYMRSLDEMHQRIMLEALALSFCVTMPLVAGLGIYGHAATPVDMVWIYVAAEIMRGIGLVVAARKYQ